MNTVINGNDVDELRAFRAAVENNPLRGEPLAILVAHWKGGSRSRIEIGDVVTNLTSD